MTEDLTVRKSIYLDASISDVWDALTNPKKTPYYMFGCAVSTDWVVGNPIEWLGDFGEGMKAYVTGIVKEVVPEKILEFTTFNPHGKLPDVIENHTTGRYELKEEGEGTRLTISQGDFQKFEDGQKRYEDTVASWDKALAALKEMVDRNSSSKSESRRDFDEDP